jgi:carbon-monoxide dehydrogenase large subunit
VAVVLADTRTAAADAAELVLVDLEPLPVVVDPERALEPDATSLFPEVGTNLAFVLRRTSGGDPHAGADLVVRGRFANQRVAPVPMETNGAVAVPDPGTGGVHVWLPTQAPHIARDDLAGALGLDPARVRVTAPSVGGGFGAKGETYPEQIAVAALALRLGRPVRYVETRSENLTAMVHGRGQIQEVEVGVTRDGRVLGLRANVLADMGAYPIGTYLPDLTADMASGVYDLRAVDLTARCAVTNTTPVGSYRGAGRPEAAAMLERAMDLVAAELGMDPAEVRRRNLVPPDAFPHTTATGVTYDTGDYPAALDRVLAASGYARLRAEQAERRRRADPRLVGIGVSTYVEVTAWGSEYGRVSVAADGSVTVLTGTAPHGQGHETAFAQIASGVLGVPMGSVRVLHSDTGVVPRGEGTMGSRSLQLGGSAVFRAGEAVVDKARRIAARMLEAGVEDVALLDPGVHSVEDGEARIGVVGAPDRSFSWAELAAAAEREPADGGAPGLWGENDFDMRKRHTFPFGAHVAVVEVDAETGAVRLLRHVAVDDAGRIVNPLLVRGQVHGGIAQGAAQALYEEVAFDEHGSPLTGSLMAYAMPSAADLPSFETTNTETPTPLNPLGAKGIGEAATVGSTPAIQSAVIDAVSHLGVRHIDMPLTPERVWRAIRDASPLADRLR